LIYLYWSLPFFVVALLIATRTMSSLNPGLVGLAAAIIVSLRAAPVHFGFHEILFATGKGAWLSFLGLLSHRDGTVFPRTTNRRR